MVPTPRQLVEYTSPLRGSAPRRGHIGGALAAALAISLGPSGAAADETTITEPYPGVTRVYMRTADQQINIIGVDLCHDGVSIRTTAPGEAGRTASSFGQLVGGKVAVNGDFFYLSGGYQTDGPSIHGGQQWTGVDHTYVAPIGFGFNQADIGQHWITNNVKPWMQEAVSGHPTILWDGNIVDHAVDPMSTDPLCTNRHPRTALGLSADKTKLVMAVVDGRRTSMKGMTCRELGNTMKFWGAAYAMNMDGGGSSTMWMDGKGVVNSPSDGSQRTVGNHLAVIAGGDGPPSHCGASFAAALVDPAELTVQVEPDQEIEVVLHFTNTGTGVWTPERTRLGMETEDPSALAHPSWLGPNRPTGVSALTAPGEVGEFRFTVRAPAEVGEYQEHFKLVHEWVKWFSDSGAGADALVFNLQVVKAGSLPGPGGTGDEADSGGCDTSGDSSLGGALCLLVALALVRVRKRADAQRN